MIHLDPSNLLTPSRLDISAKLGLAKRIIEGTDETWGRELFSASLMALNPLGAFSEDNIKFSIDDYLVEFRRLLGSLSKHGFDSSISIIPLAQDGSIWNGAHRIAACIALGAQVATEATHELPQTYDWHFFKRAGLHHFYLDEMAWEFCKASKNSRAIVLSGLGPSESAKVMGLLSRKKKVFFEKSLELNDIGMRRQIKLLYDHLDWFSNDLLEKLVLERFQSGSSAIVCLYEEPNGASSREIKEELRELLGPREFERKIHGSDDWEETLKIAEIWTNTNSLKFHTSSPIGSETRVLELLELESMRGFQDDGLTIDGGSTLELHGIRQTSDIDHICNGAHAPKWDTLGDCHRSAYLDEGMPYKQVLYDPRYFLRFSGFKFSSLQWELTRLPSKMFSRGPDLRAIVDFLEQDSPTYIDKDRMERMRAWQRRSVWSLRLDRFLALLGPRSRRFIGRTAAIVRSALRRK